MTDAEKLVARDREIGRTYDRVGAQITWLLGERGVDDAGIATNVIRAMRGEPVAEPFTISNRRNVIGRLALLWLWRGPFLAKEILVAGPLLLERLAAGEGTMSEAMGTLHALEREPTEVDPLLARLRAVLVDDADAIADVWCLEERGLQERIDAIRARLSTPEGREVLEGVLTEMGSRAGDVQ